MIKAELVDISEATAPRLVTEVPGPLARAHVDYDHTWSSPSLPRAYPFVPVRGRGATVEDIDGNVFVDFCAGIAVNSTGHSHPAVIQAIKVQAEELVHYSASDFYPPIYARMCEAIAATAPISGPLRVFLGNSGAEAVEAALKLARKATRRHAVVSFLGGFHGRTMGAVTLTASKAKYHAGLSPLLGGVYHAPYGHAADVDWFEKVLFDKIVPADEVAGIIVEPVQGEGGYIVPEAGFLQGLREICDRHGILFIADEIQSGAGRTGTMWAIEHFGVEPDILLSAKGIASGMPLSALVTKADILEAWDKGAHGSTYGGNPVACAAALVTMELLADGLIQNAAARGVQGLEALRDMQSRHPQAVVDVRGLGLMLALELATPQLAEALEYEAFTRGLLLLGCGAKSVRISPPLVIDAATMASGLRVLEDSLAAVSGGRATALPASGGGGDLLAAAERSA
jgi:4-aminobutyrate aminotransferase